MIPSGVTACATAEISDLCKIIAEFPVRSSLHMPIYKKHIGFPCGIGCTYRCTHCGPGITGGMTVGYIIHVGYGVTADRFTIHNQQCGGWGKNIPEFSVFL